MSRKEQEGAVRVSADSSAPLVANIRMGTETTTVDETGILEGNKTGPDPYDYILSALGSCTVITLHMYAQRKGWPLERAEVSLSHGRVHPDDCEHCEDETAKLSQITKHLHLTGDLTAEQRKRLKIISSKCPVQKTLEAGISIVTEMEDI